MSRPRIQGLGGTAELSVADQIAKLEARIAQLEATPTSPQVQADNFAAKEGQFIVVEAPPEGLSALLPQPRAQNRNKRITINAKNSNPIRLLSVNGLVNNQPTVVSTSPGTFDAVSDGATGWFITSQAASAAGSSSSAEVLLGSAHPSFPDGLVATDSTSIDVDLTTPGIVKWAPVGGFFTWSYVLSQGATSGASNPIVDVGQFMQFGAVGPTTNSPQIRSGDAAFRIAGGGALTELSGASQVRVSAAATGTSAALSYVIGGVARWTILGNGEWSTPAGTSGQFWKHNGAAFPVWATLALSDLPSQAADTFVGRLAGAGTPTVQLLSDIDSTSIIYDATSHTFQRAALTGAIVSTQNSNATKFAGILDNGSAENDRTNLNFLSTTSVVTIVTDDSVNDELEITHERAALTGDVTASQNSNATTIANDVVSNVKLANMAQATIKLRASGAGTGDPIDGTITQALDMASGTNGAMLARSSAAGNIWTIVPNQANGRHCITDGSGAATWADPTTGSGGTLSLASTGSLSVVPDNNMDITTDVGNGVGFSRNMNRCIWWDDFTVVQGVNVATGFTYITCETGWVCTNNTAATTANVSCFDGGASGTATAPGEVNIATNAVLGTQVDFHKGLNNTTRCFRASDIRSIKFKAKITSTAAVHVSLGLNDRSFGALDCARFDYDPTVAANWQAISANSGGATTTTTSTGVAPTTNYVEFEIRSPSASSLNWEYYMDGVLKVTHVTTSKSRGVNLHFSIANLTAANKDLRIDYVSFETWPTR